MTPLQQFGTAIWLAFMLRFLWLVIHEMICINREYVRNTDHINRLPRHQNQMRKENS